MDHVIQLVNAANTAITWKDCIPLGSALIAGGLTVLLVYINNKRLLDGQIKTQKELFEHQARQLQQQLSHDLEKYNKEHELEKYQLFFTNKVSNTQIIAEMRQAWINVTRDLFTDFLTEIFMMESCYSQALAIITSNFNQNNKTSDALIIKAKEHLEKSYALLEQISHRLNPKDQIDENSGSVNLPAVIIENMNDILDNWLKYRDSELSKNLQNKSNLEQYYSAKKELKINSQQYIKNEWKRLKNELTTIESDMMSKLNINSDS